MGKLPLAFIFLLCVSAFPQRSDVAHATYGRRGEMLSLTDLAPLRDCRVQSADGKAKNIKVTGGIATFELKSADGQRQAFRFPLSRLEAQERKQFRHKFLQGGVLLRASGYACGNDGDAPLEAISIDRVY